ncbi:MAG: HAMP domain-containing histidine kinase [Lachnospiraceae bacterium]|nr:HAMP domain-containing histidine kinase [Lachnospiraceae bacterium]
MDFLYEKRTRIFCIFLVGLCILQTGFMGISGMFQARGLRSALIERERAAASYLLEKEVPPSLLAAAWNQTEGTAEGAAFLEKIGHTERTQSYLMLLAGETSVPLILLQTAEGVLFSAVLLLGAAFFLRRRERLYVEAEAVVAQYADGRFDVHLPIGETGAVHRFFGKVEQLAMSLQAKSEAEHRAKEFLKDMISNISHQLKTPLAALDMYMEILGEEPENAETVKDFSRKSMRSLERMEQLIQSLLKMARLDTGSIVFEKRQCFVAEIAAQAAGELSERARQEGKKIVMEGGSEEIIFCDEDWTREALENLIKNALDHTEAGGTVRVAWSRSPVLFRLSVEDDGCGIAPEDIHHIFKKFYRSQNSGDRQGINL